MKLDRSDKYEQMKEVRNGMEKARLLLDLIKKREMLKREQVFYLKYFCVGKFLGLVPKYLF
jgi:hypothetical protein